MPLTKNGARPSHRPPACAPSRAGVVFTIAVAAAALATTGAATAGEPDASVTWNRLGLAGEQLETVESGPDGMLLAGGGPNGGSGMFRSTDGGGTWAPVNTGLGTIHRVNDIAVQPDTVPPEGAWTATQATSPTVLIGVMSAAGSNLYRTTDLGDSWSPATTGLPSTIAEVTAIVFDPSQPTVAYAGLNGGGVARSTDGGQTWSDSSTGLGLACGGVACVLDLALDPALPTTLFAALPADSDVYASTDGGGTWAPAGAGIAAEALAVGAANPATVVATATLDGLVRSADGGATWTDLASNPGLPSGASHRAVALGPGESDIWLVAESLAGELVYRSVDAGQTWTTADAGLEGLRVRDLTVVGRTVLAATDDGVYRCLVPLFADGFESGDASGWSAAVP